MTYLVARDNMELPDTGQFSKKEMRKQRSLMPTRELMALSDKTLKHRMGRLTSHQIDLLHRRKTTAALLERLIAVYKNN